jgi:hypothetical protein
MPTEIEIIEPIPERLGKAFWAVAHNLLCHGDEDMARANAAIAWFHRALSDVQRIASEVQHSILMLIYNATKTSGAAPSLALIRDTAGDAYEDFFEEYEDLAKKLPLVPATDLPVLVKKWEAIRRRQLALAAITQAGEIAVGKGGDALLGAETAMDFLAETRDKLFRSATQTSTFVTMGDYRSQEIIQQGSDSGSRKVIPTGFPGFDQVLAMSPGQVVGVLGGAGAGKSRLARSIGYNMASAGYRVLHVQLETHEVAEVIYYALIHAFQGQTWASTAQSFALTFNKLNRGVAAPAATAWLNDVVLADMREVLPGSISILSPASNRWDQIQNEIETLHREHGFDAVIIDYLTLCEAGSGRDKDGRVIQAITEATHWAQRSDLLLVTPVQGRRDAAVKAREEADGLWDLSGIYKYSDYDRHLTACLSLSVMPNEAIHLGLPKNRWGAPVFTPVIAGVNHACGYISEKLLSVSQWNNEMTFDDLEDDIR